MGSARASRKKSLNRNPSRIISSSTICTTISILPKSPASIPLKRRCIVQVNCHKVHTLNTHYGLCCCVYRFSNNFHSNSQKNQFHEFPTHHSRHELARKPHQNYYSRVSMIRKKILDFTALLEGKHLLV